SIEESQTQTYPRKQSRVVDANRPHDLGRDLVETADVIEDLLERGRLERRLGKPAGLTRQDVHQSRNHRKTHMNDMQLDPVIPEFFGEPPGRFGAQSRVVFTVGDQDDQVVPPKVRSQG